VQLVELHGWHRRSLLLDVQPMEIVGSRARLAQHPLHRACIDITNVRAGCDRTAVAQTFQDAVQRFVGHFGVFMQGAATFAETLAAMRAIQSANVFAFADPFDDAEIASVEAIAGGAIFVGTREVRQRVWLAA